jgi:cytochrome c-type biogenesis protein CcmE
MKKSHFFVVIIIAVAIGIIVATAGDASTYVTFEQAYQLASNGQAKDIHVVGSLKKNAAGDVVGIIPGADKVSFEFLLIDEKGREQNVLYNEPMPPDFLRSEKVVVIGKYAGNRFVASKILLKCPSKYQDETIKTDA